MLKEFKDFINKGNVVDLAVAVVLGAAFGLVINSFVNDILMQIVAAIFGQPDFNGISIHWGDPESVDDLGRTVYDGGTIFIGSFITQVISFLSVAAGVFLAVKAYNKMQKPKVEEDEGPSEIDLLTEIRDSLGSRS